jgi:glycosyltransferase involved in cell wall biosynthesis
MIVKDESQAITRCLSSLKHLIDYWVIVDTGSTDGTQAIIQDYLKDIPGKLYERPWVDFAHNRNEAQNFAKGKGDYLLFIDADERLEFSNGFALPVLDKDCYFATVLQTGNTEYHRILLVNQRVDWHWEGVLHEQIISAEKRTAELLQNVVNVSITTDGHRSSDPKKYHKDAAVLEKALEKDPDNSRYVYYLGQSYANAGELAQALKCYQRRAEMGGWDQEVFSSLFYVGRLQEMLKMDPALIVNSYTNAFYYRPSRAEPLYYLANYYIRNENYLMGYLVASQALGIPLSNDSVYVERWIYDWGILQQISNCAFYLRKYKEAESAVQKIITNERAPSELRAQFRENLQLLKQINGEMQSRTKTIGIFTFPVAGRKPWDGDSIHSGITGSEEAVIYMSEELAKIGYQVIVFGTPPLQSRFSKEDANPRFVEMHSFHLPEMLDIAIAWRMPKSGIELKKIAHKVYLWPHDTCNVNLSDAEINAFTDVLWISKWQREQWISVNPKLAPFKQIFGNGVAACQFQPIEERKNPYACIYGSNYARGLDVLLEIWPVIKQQYPRATLDIYYGWQHWGLMSAEKEADLCAQIKQLESLDVREHGMVGHEELNRAYAKASFWTYPCTMAEVFCITGLRAQRAGSVPVIIDGSALTETVRHGYKCATPKEYLYTLLQAMKGAEKITLQERKRMGEFIDRDFTWQSVAQDWHRLFEFR